MEREKVCVVCLRGDRPNKLRRFDCVHFYHTDCIRGELTASCPHCTCCMCMQPITVPEYFCEPCRCAIHNSCRPGRFSKSPVCGRCKQPVKRQVQFGAEPTAAPAVSAAPPATPPAEVARPAPAVESAPVAAQPSRLGAFFSVRRGASTREISAIGEAEGVEGLLRANVTLAQFFKTGLSLKTLRAWGLTPDTLARLGATREQLLDPALCDLDSIVGAGVRYAVLKATYGITWADFRAHRPPFATLVLLGARLVDLCRDGFTYEDLLFYRRTPFRQWIGDPFCLEQSTYILLPNRVFSMELTQERLDELREDNPGNWTVPQIKQLWSPEDPPGAFHDMLGLG